MPRFVHTKLLSPVVLDGHTAAPKKSREWMDYWREEERRCKEGYSVGDIAITGRHYHYLNYWKIRRRKPGAVEKTLAPPRFLDFDYDFYWNLEKCLKEGKDMLYLKRRQCGFSFKTSQIGGYNFTFKPASWTVYTSGLAEYATTTFGMMLEGLNNSVGTPFYRHRGMKDEKDHIQAGWKEKIDGQNIWKGYKSQCQIITATEMQSLIGKSPSAVIYEEIGKFPGFLDVKGYIDPGMKSEGVKTGINVCIGTGGEENESIDEVSEAFYNPDSYGFYSVENEWDKEEELLEEDLIMDDAPAVPTEQKTKVCFFMPGYLYDPNVDEDGNSMIEENLAAINEARAKAKGTRQELKTITQMPITPQEALLIPSGGKFNIAKLRSQYSHIMRTPRLRNGVRRGEIDFVYVGGNVVDVEWKDSESGRFRMIEPPYKDPVSKKVPENLYVAGTDSYDIDRTADNTGTGSFGACYIYKTFHSAGQRSNMFVCSVTERPATAKEFWDDTIKLCLLYGGCQNLIEYSNKLIGEHYLKKGYAHLLKDRPEVAYQLQKSEGPQNQWGVDPSTKPYWIQKLKDYIEDHVGSIMDPYALSKLIKYKDKIPGTTKPYNCDDTIAMSLAIVHAQDKVHLMDQNTEQEAFNGISYVYSGGRIQRSGW